MDRLLDSQFNTHEASSQHSLTSMPSIIAYHGWGFAANCWEGWQQTMEQRGYRFQAFNRGYFGQPVSPKFAASDGPKIIWAHSYGLHLCPVEQLQQADGLVLFSSFRDFHPVPPQRRRSEYMLQQMIDRFAKEPQLVLSRFKAKSYHPVSWSEENQEFSLNTDLLLHDLQALNDCSLDLNLLQALPQIGLLHGTADRIVPVAKSAELAAVLPQSQFFEIADAGHALPFTHSLLCESMCEPILNTILQSSFPS